MGFCKRLGFQLYVRFAVEGLRSGSVPGFGLLAFGFWVCGGLEVWRSLGP